MVDLMRNGRWWILTIPYNEFVPYLPVGVEYIKGQLERGDETEYLHWQVVCATSRRVALAAIRKIFGPWHAELTRSAAAREYVWKDDTGIAGTRFELGNPPTRRNSATDWGRIKDNAKIGNFDEIPDDIFIRHYSALRTIRSDYATCSGIEKNIFVFWGPTGTGKSRTAWESAGADAYGKDPRSKFWDGYQGEKCVVMDEFRGAIDISHLLRWFDRYPVRVEIKGSSRPLCAESIWITSNLKPSDWYPDLDSASLDALLRRLVVREFN
nr:rep protein [Cressdnaviricota sp.]